MTIEYAAIAVGAFLAMILMWERQRVMAKRLRKTDVRLRKVEEELKEFQILYSRLFMTTMTARPKVDKSHAEVIALVPPSNPMEADQQSVR